MTYAEFRKRIIEKAHHFSAYWAKEHDENPNEFTQELDEDAWWSRFELWLETNRS